MAQADLQRFQLLRRDPWEFCRQAVFTLDQTDKERPVKPFPSELEYLRLYIRLWQKYKRVAVPKSRRMFMSWVNIALYLHDSMFNIGRSQAFVSKKEEDSDALVRRAKFIYDHIPEEVIPRDLLPKASYKYGNLTFQEIDSNIKGFAQGQDQLRQYTFSGILADEMAFWENAQQMYSTSIPTIEGGGRFTAISSPAPGFFKYLVYDRLDDAYGGSQADEDASEGIKRIAEPIPGTVVWKNEKNGFLVFELHWTADPRKGSDYIKEIRRSMPRQQFMQEFELQWDSFAGAPVYPDFDKSVHAVKGEINPELGLPLLIGFDFGLTPAAVICQMQGDTLCVLKEYTAINMGIDRFSEQVMRSLRQLYPQWYNFAKHYLCYIDPSGDFRKDTDENTCAKILIQKGFKPVPGALTWEERKQSVEFFINKFSKSGPCLKVSIPNCPMIYKGFTGGYRYPDQALELEPNKIRPVKDEHSHPHDALQYLASRIRSMLYSKRTAIPKPTYGFTKPA